LQPLLSIQTEIIKLDNYFAVVKAAVKTQKGKFNGTGTASVQKDAKLADSLVELAETGAIARDLRFGGVGVESATRIPPCNNSRANYRNFAPTHAGQHIALLYSAGRIQAWVPLLACHAVAPKLALHGREKYRVSHNQSVIISSYSCSLIPSPALPRT
jgi:hypothetical protein